ncbi:AP2/ERF and B3 domain-containing transcription factor At1g51120-like [Phalaenopsis equestris]|uniref:AP2/ERF and B3 domain-containing transcription factor At1g51120-like n=1 Tax=Phalaenopsis equestris TaxID=78828 RepID=UPI0009E43AFC|nr:AP2/ERF and B3 domain-containing transcription factor At1g51120-like [Phalaenopsis equestris]
MNIPKSVQKQQSDGATSSRIPSTQAEQVVCMAEQNEGPSHLISSSHAGQLKFTLPLSKFEGVFCQQNGHWGAKIFIQKNHILLGTFNSQIAAARAYDSAALKLLNNEFLRNLLLTNVTIHEPIFQNMYDPDVIINMIRDGSYEPNYIEFLSNHYPSFRYSDSIVMPSSLDVIEGVLFKEMFRKELLMGDITNENLLVLPNEAQSCFQPFNSNPDELWFEYKDRRNRSWEFQLCPTNNPQTYVITTGWKKFFNEVELRVNDIVLFYRCKDMRSFPCSFFSMIDVIRGAKNHWMQRRY